MTFQNDLYKLAKRDATERDYTSWLGVRALTDAAMRAGKTSVPDIKQFILSKDFNLEGHKELLGLWLGQTEGAKVWLGCLTDLKKIYQAGDRGGRRAGPEPLRDPLRWRNAQPNQQIT